MKLLFYLSALLVCFAPIRSDAQQTYTPSQLVDAALSNNSELKAAELNSLSAESLANQANLWENPRVEISTENNQQPGGETNSVRVGVAQSLFLPGRYNLKRKLAGYDVDVAKLEVNSTRLRVRSQVLKLVYEYQVSKEKLKHAEERLQRFKTAQEFLSSRTFVSPQKKAEASIVTGKLVVLQKELFHTQAASADLWNALNFYLKMQTEPKIVVNWFTEVKPLVHSELTSQISSGNLALQQQSLKIQQVGGEADLLKYDIWPGLTIGGSYSSGWGYNPEKVIGLGISIPVPVFNANRYAITASQSRAKSESERLNYLRDLTNRDLTEASLNFELARKSVASLPVKRIESLERAMKENDRGFQRGQVDLLTYLEADSQHFESLSAILDSQLDLVKSAADLQALTGNNQIGLGN